MSEDFNITDLFFAGAEKHPERTALICKDKKISFGEFSKSILDTAAFFEKKGIGKGDRVLIFVPMSIDLYRIVLALFRIGAIAVFLDEWVSKKRMEECCKVAQCKAFIGSFKARLLSLVSKDLRSIPIRLGKSYTKGIPASKKNKVTFSDTALITFTTGSTGIPKAAKRTHGFLLEQFAALNEKLDPKAGDIIMPVLPIVLLINLGNGTTSVIADYKAAKPASLDPARIIRQAAQHHVNGIIASPFFIKEIAKHMIREKLRLPEVEKIFTGGAPVFPAEAEIYDKAFPDARVDVVYGSTEAEPISMINVKELKNEKDKMLSEGLKVGIPYRKTEVNIIEITDSDISVKDESGLKKLPAGSIGEIIVSGPHVLREYINNDAALKRNKIFIGEKCWHRTGDSGYVDAGGTLYLTGRCSTILIDKGKIIAPFIYENYFQNLPGVEIGSVMKFNGSLSAVIELNDPSLKEEVKLAIGKLELDIPDVKFLDRIPRDPRHNSKIDYEQLKKQFAK